MPTTLPERELERLLEPLDQLATADANAATSTVRQPVHTVYGGAHLFRADTTVKLGRLACKALDAHAPDAFTFARAVRMQGHETLPANDDSNAWAQAYEEDAEALRARHPGAWLALAVNDRMRAKLAREPVEDFRIDFEDGFGHRPDEEEDAAADRAAREVAVGMAAGTLPPFLGIRIKSLTPELRGRAARTLDRFVSGVVEASGGHLPPGFAVTLPKVEAPLQVTTLVRLFEALETSLGLPSGALVLELMVETTASLIDTEGQAALPHLAAAAGKRCRGAHFGVYDYTAALEIAAAHQRMDHPACDLARGLMQVSLAGSGIQLSDGATNVMPVGPHRATATAPLDADALAVNQQRVHAGWRLHYQHVRQSLTAGFFQGWDLHPAQLPTRYAAVYAFFLEGLDAATARLSSFVNQAAQATLLGDVFDDAATGQGLLNFFLRGLGCGAITEAEAAATGLTRAELETRSFLAIVQQRRHR